MTKGETLLQSGTGNERTINKSYSNAPVDILYKGSTQISTNHQHSQLPKISHFEHQLPHYIRSFFNIITHSLAYAHALIQLAAMTPLITTLYLSSQRSYQSSRKNNKCLFLTCDKA